MEGPSGRIRKVIHATAMKRSNEVPPLRVGAHLRPDSLGHEKLEWSRIEDFDATVDIGFPSNKATDFLLRIKRWIDARIGAYEDEVRMLRRLYRTERLEIVVTDEPASPERIEPYVQAYWKSRQTRHYRRMVIAGAAVLPALVLTVLPGPNIVGIPLAYLAWHHWRIVRGINRVRSGEIQVELKMPPKVIRPGLASSSASPDTRPGHDETHEAVDVQHS